MASMPHGGVEQEVEEVIIISSDSYSEDDTDDTESHFNAPQHKIVKVEPEVETVTNQE